MNDILTWLLIIAAVIVGLLLYGLPTAIAFHRKHHYKWIIFAINAVAGATGIGYLVALVWALWPSRTGLADPFLNDPTTNTVAAGQTIYGRYGANRRAFLEPGKLVFLLRDGQQFGPYTKDEILSMLAAGMVVPADLSWFEGAENWMPISAVPELAAAIPPSAL